MKIKLIVIIGLVITTFAACLNTPNETPSSKADNADSGSSKNAAAAMLPSFKVTAIDGSTINMADLKGKKVFVNLWASWCPPCRAEMPSIEKLYSKVDKNKVVFVMLSLDDNFDKAKEFLKSNNLELPIYYPAEKLPELFNIEGIPATFIFNEKGELIKENNGGDNYDTSTYVELLK